MLAVASLRSNDSSELLQRFEVCVALQRFGACAPFSRFLNGAAPFISYVAAPLKGDSLRFPVALAPSL